MEEQKAEIVRFPIKLRKDISKLNIDRKAPKSKALDGFAFPQRLWEVILDLTSREEAEFVNLRMPKHQMNVLAWLALTSGLRKENKPPLEDLEWFNLDEEKLMSATKRAISVIIDRQYEAEINALKKGNHPFLKPLVSED